MIKTLAQILLGLPDNNLRLIMASDSRAIAEGAFGALLPMNPTVNDDIVNSNGNGFFDARSRWMNSNDGSIWECESGAPGAAVWVKIYPQGAAAAVVLPGAGIRVDVSGTDYTVSDLPGQSYPTFCTTFRNSTDCNLSNFAVVGMPSLPTHDFILSVVFRTNFPGQTATVMGLADNSGESFQIQLISSAIRVGITTSGGGLFSPCVVPVGSAGAWQHVLYWYHYDPVSPMQYLLVDGTKSDSQPVVFLPEATQGIALGGEYFMGTWYNPYRGDLAELFLSDVPPGFTMDATLWNGGCTYLYDQLPCKFNGLLFQYFPLEQDAGHPAVDLLNGTVLSQGALPTQRNPGVCGMRLGCVGVLPSPPPTSIVLPSDPTPTPPPSGNIDISFPGSGYFPVITDPAGYSFPDYGLHPREALQRGGLFGGSGQLMYHLAGFANQWPGLSAHTARNAGDMFAIPMMVYNGGSLQSVAVKCNTGVMGNNGLLRFGVYVANETPGDLYPVSLVADLGTVAIVGTPLSFLAFDLAGGATLLPGREYWLCCQQEESAGIIGDLPPSGFTPVCGTDLSNLSSGGVVAVLSNAPTGGLPDPFPTPLLSTIYYQNTSGFIYALFFSLAD